MKTSTKILIAGFTTILLLVVAVHATWYSRYKSGNYSVYNVEEMQSGTMQTFPNVTFVSILNLNGTSVTFADEAQVPKNGNKDISYRHTGDTLVISVPEAKEFQPARIIRLPVNATLSLVNSSISFGGSRDGKAINAKLFLRNSQAHFSGLKPLMFNDVSIVAEDSSTAIFNSNVAVRTLDVRLANSMLDFNGSNADSLHIETDAASRISLPYKHLVKANINSR